MMRERWLWCVGISAFVMGCMGAVESGTAGNAALGIARFTSSETATRSTVVGLDAAGKEVGRLDLVHGRFTLSGIFADGYTDPNVDALLRHSGMISTRDSRPRR